MSQPPADPTCLPDVIRFAEVSQQLLTGEDAQQVLQRVVALAVETIGPCDFAGVSLRHHGTIDTPACTHPVVAESDALQYVLKQGPCLDAIWDEDTCLVHDLTTEERWPDWAPAAARLGLRSVLSLRLSTQDRVVGGLNLYSLTAAAYTQDDVATAHVYAMHASAAIRQSQEAAGLRVALATRRDIGVAQGMIMARLDVDQDTAFGVLRRISQNNNVRLAEVAAMVVARRGRLGELPWRA